MNETTPPIMTITDELLAELEQLAGKATPGPYRQCGADKESKSCACGQVWSTATDELVSIAHNGDAMIDAPVAGQSANSQYLAAASPATILALLQHVRELKADAERLDSLDKLCEAYGFEGVHEGNRWVIDGPFRSIRDAIDSLPDDFTRSSAD